MQTTNKRPRPPSSTVLEVYSNVWWAVPRLTSTHLGMGLRGTRVFSSHFSSLSSGDRRHETQSLPVPDPGANHTQTHDSGQIRAATIAYHKDHEKKRNFQEAHVSPRRTLSSYLVTPNDAISLNHIFVTDNILEYKTKSKKRESGFKNVYRRKGKKITCKTILPEIILLTRCFYHRGTRLNGMKRICLRSL